MMTDVGVGSPEATPSVNGSTPMSASGTVATPVRSLESDVEHAVMTTVAPRARKERRDIGSSGDTGMA